MRKIALFLLLIGIVQSTFASSPFLTNDENYLAAACTGNADAVIIDLDVVSEAEALGAPDDSGAFIDDRGNQLGLDISETLQIGETYTIRWRRSLATMGNPTFTVEESLDGSSWIPAAGSPFTETSTTFSNNNIVATANMRYIRITTTDVYDLEVDAISYTNAQCCTTFVPTVTVFQGTCNGTIPNDDGSVTLSNILASDRADISSPRALSYDGDDYASAETVTAGSISFFGLLQQNSKYIVRIFESGGACFNDISIVTADSPPTCPSPPAELPWNGSICGSQTILLQNGIAALSCGVTAATPVADRWAFALMNFDTILPATGRSEETTEAEAYHHPSWHVDSIGNVFGVAINNSTGEIFTTASTNYGAGFLGNNSVIRYGEIAGGTSDGNNDSAAGGAVYRLDPGTEQASVFAFLPQQSLDFTHLDSESNDTQARTNSGVGLGNIVYDEVFDQYFVSNIEDGRIYRLNSAGVIQDSYDPFANDDGVAGISDLEELVYGLAVETSSGRLFFGGVDSAPGASTQFAEAGSPAIYSITLTSAGGFPGTVNNLTLPSGATYDNYEQVSETFHTNIPTGSGFSYSQNYIYMISDLAFNQNDQLVAGIRVSTKTSFFTSYNHWGETTVIDKNGGTQLYSDNLTELGISVPGDAAPEDSYGGVASYADASGTPFYAISSADILEEAGPHGIAIFSDPPNAGDIDPLAAISYGLAGNDPKGVGGDIEVWTGCLEFDLALKKTLVTSGTLKPEDDVVFEIKIYNQGNVMVKDVEVRDYLPEGLRLNDPNWISPYDSLAIRMIDDIAAGDSVVLNITLRINSGFQSTTGVLINSAEITSTSGGQDSDSPLTILNDGSTNELATDNDINDEGPGTPGIADNPVDEDDYDAALIIVICPPADCLPVEVEQK